MFRFKIGQEVYGIYRVKNNKGINKWHVADGKRKIIDIKNKYIFATRPFRAKEIEVFETYKEAEKQCGYRNHWGKYHKNIDYRGKRKHR